MDIFFTQIPLYQIIILAVVVVTFIFQIVYWLRYAAISSYRNRHRVASKDQLPAVSVIVVVGDNLDYIENELPLLLEQEHPQFEVVVVNDCGGVDIDDELAKLSRAYANLKFTTLKKDDKFNHSRKIPLVVGIKAAQYENIVITDCDALPTNEKWLSYMCRGFSGADLVIGYTGFEIQKGLTNKISRCSRLSTSIRYLRAAISGKPYRGIYNNLGYTKSVFFDNKGYTNLSMTIGEDDLFVQKIARRCDSSVIINPQSTLRQKTYDSMSWWWNERRYRSFSFKFFPMGVKLNIFTELFTRMLFFLTAIGVGVISTLGLVSLPYVWAGAALVLLLRELIVLLSVKKIAKRLGEIKIVWSFMIYDFLAPIFETLLYLSRRISPPKNVWIQNSK